MSLVFDPDWITELKGQYAHRPRFQQPALYHFATHPKWESKRQVIENSVAALSSTVQHRVIKCLRNPDQFFTTRNELFVGDWLRSLGYDPEYERALGTQTPDWYVSVDKISSEFLVEVASILAPKVIQDEQRLWQELRDRLDSIEHFFYLWIGTINTSTLKGKKMKPIVRFVQNWLDQFDPTTTHDVHDIMYRDTDLEIEFKLVPRQIIDRKTIATSGPVFSQWVDINLLKGTISKKINKYKKAKDLHIPLVIAIVPTFDSGFSIETLMDVLFGREQVVIPTGDINRDRSGMLTLKSQHDQLAVFNTRLSAIIWVEDADQSNFKVIHNPYACNPVQVQAFPGVPNLSVVEQDDYWGKLGWVVP